MSEIHFVERAVAQVVEQYVASRKSRDLPVSTAHALRAIRTVLPNCDMSDRELTDLVAASAIKSGRTISFDGSPMRGA
ncbi:hypothetical protein [Aquamicrobium sp. LC103]|uniref:hypothetical protein n=1 Tax=Aquamicrobium sp. LC103 TaxID=1120658 RepID=UPI00063EAE1A|nr:hypothetical protein [Aquamicrobium sp. LC103]TKT82645.1 hypothetical protein XW59_001410 [Aquamicrobium sp. LC103]